MGELRAVVYMSWATWVAKCPRPWCVHADHYGPGPNTGRLGGLTKTAFHCLRCGLICPADWPPNAADIEVVLAQRPMYETRNWRPGEYLDDLIVENITHGLVDPAQIPAGLFVYDDRLTDASRRMVTAAPLAIGG
jgi:hypothetical protein